MTRKVLVFFSALTVFTGLFFCPQYWRYYKGDRFATQIQAELNKNSRGVLVSDIWSSEWDQVTILQEYEHRAVASGSCVETKGHEFASSSFWGVVWNGQVPEGVWEIVFLKNGKVVESFQIRQNTLEYHKAFRGCISREKAHVRIASNPLDGHIILTEVGN